MSDLPPVVAAYVDAYNLMDVDAMLSCLSDDVHFRNFTGPDLTAEAKGIAEFEAMARAGVRAFQQRRQTVRHAVTVAETTVVEIDYAAVVAMDLPNGWKAGQALSFGGASCFRVLDGRIVALDDQS